MASTTSLNYDEHFTRLQTIAKKLQQSPNLNVDELLGDVKTALESYGFCRQRIDAADAELKDLLAKAAPAEGTGATE